MIGDDPGRRCVSFRKESGTAPDARMMGMNYRLLLRDVSLMVVGWICCLSLSGWAQAPADFQDGPPPAQMEPQARPGMRPFDNLLMQMGSDAGEIRIDWNKLGLSPQQKAQLIRKRREFQIAAAGLREELKFVESDLRTEMIKSPGDRAKIEEILHAMSTLKLKLSEAAVNNLLAIKGILTPEQLHQLADMQQPFPPELNALQLTAEQRVRIQELIKGSLRQTREASQRLFDLREELQEVLLSAEMIEAEKLTALQTEIIEHELELEQSRIDLFWQLRETLTPQQIKQYNKFRERLQSEMPPDATQKREKK